MTSKITPVVKQFGFTPATGALANLVDGNQATGWAPQPTTLQAYTDDFLDRPSVKWDGIGFGISVTTPSFPALEFDFGVPVRIPTFSIKTETPHTCGPAMLIASDNPATGVNDTVQAGDIMMGTYSQRDIVQGKGLNTNAVANDIRKRYYRLCFRVIAPGT
jgi:hypothetical protein